jgi:MFS family permease
MPPSNDPFSLRAIAVPAFGPSLMLGLSEGAIYPIFVLSAVELGASPAAAGLIMALVPIGQTLANLPAAMIASRWGERRAMVAAALFGFVALASCLAARSVPLFGISVFMFGLSGSVFRLARQTFLIEAAPMQIRARAISTLAGMMRVGMFIGPFAAAAFIQWFDFAGAYWFAMSAMLGAGAIALSVPDLPGDRSASVRPRSVGRELQYQIQSHMWVFLTLGTASALVAALRSCRQIVIPLWATTIGLDATSTALIYGLMSAMDMLLFYPAGKIMDLHGRLGITLASMITMGSSFCLIILANGFYSLLAASLLMGFSNGISSGLIFTVGADASPKQGRTEFLGIWRMVSDSGQSAGPLLLSALTAGASLATGVFAIGGLGFVAAWMFWRWLPRNL